MTKTAADAVIGEAIEDEVITEEEAVEYGYVPEAENEEEEEYQKEDKKIQDWGKVELPDIDLTEGKETPEGYEKKFTVVVTAREDEKKIETQGVIEFVKIDQEARDKEEIAKQEEKIQKRIRQLRYLVATGEATKEEKEDLKLLLM